MIVVDGQTVGSSLIGQSFDDPKYFSGRPSAAGAGYDANPLRRIEPGPDFAGVDRPDLGPGGRIAQGQRRRADPRGSGHGLRLRARPGHQPGRGRVSGSRVAKARGMTEDAVRAMVARHTSQPFLGFIGAASVHVLQLNLDLDGLLK